MDYKEAQKTFWGEFGNNGYVHYLDWGGSFTGIYKC